MTVDALLLVLHTDAPIREPASKLRGAIGRAFPEHLLLHQHIGDEGYLYAYPRVQYKVLAGTAAILGIEDGAQVLNQISDDIVEFTLGKNLYKVKRKALCKRKTALAPADQLLAYRFASPWLGLNQSNHQIYQELQTWRERKRLVNRVLVGNILSMCKGLGIVVEKELCAHTHLYPDSIAYKSTRLLGFTGEFAINFTIPDFFGLGKSVSQGFGVVLDASRSQKAKSSSGSHTNILSPSQRVATR
jgi:hypothetical protein